MALVKIECPYCRRHYTIEESERGGIFECLSCGQSFNGAEAAVVGWTGSERLIRLLLVLALVMVPGNVLFWIRQLDPPPAPTKVNAGKAAPIPALADLDALSSRLAALEKSVEELRAKERNAAAEKNPAADAAAGVEPDVIRTIFFRLGRIESDVAKLKERRSSGSAGL